MTMLILLRQRRGVLETPYQIGAAFTPTPRVSSWTCPIQEYVDSLSFAALRRYRYIGALQKALHTSIARLSPLKLARERVQCNITTQYITLKGSARRESMPTLNGTWHNGNTLALRGVRAVRTDPLAGVRLGGLAPRAWFHQVAPPILSVQGPCLRQRVRC
jgi:hypothetical protein